jgi:cytochrome c oxidase assembly protein subunit 15
MTAFNAEQRRDLQRFSTLLGWAAFLTFDLIALGSLVRAADAGLACPDWPLCYDQVVPVFDTQIFLEWFHRVVAAVLSFMILAATIQVLRKPFLRKIFGTQLAVAGILLLVQIILGGLTVLHLLNPSTVASHLINALLFFTLLVWISVKARLILRPEDMHPTHFKVPTSVRRVFFALTGVMLAQISLGGMVSTNHAGLACPDFPTCHGEWLPPANRLIWLQMGHRYLAAVVLILGVALAMMTLRTTLPPLARLAMRLFPTLIVVQITLGIINVVYYLPIVITVAHLANAAAIYALLVMACVELAASRSLITTRAETFDEMAQKQWRPKPNLSR